MLEACFDRSDRLFKHVDGYVGFVSGHDESAELCELCLGRAQK